MDRIIVNLLVSGLQYNCLVVDVQDRLYIFRELCTIRKKNLHLRVNAFSSRYQLKFLDFTRYYYYFSRYLADYEFSFVTSEYKERKLPYYLFILREIKRIFSIETLPQRYLYNKRMISITKSIKATSITMQIT